MIRATVGLMLLLALLCGLILVGCGDDQATTASETSSSSRVPNRPGYAGGANATVLADGENAGFEVAREGPQSVATAKRWMTYVESGDYASADSLVASEVRHLNVSAEQADSLAYYKRIYQSVSWKVQLDKETGNTAEVLIVFKRGPISKSESLWQLNADDPEKWAWQLTMYNTSRGWQVRDLRKVDLKQ
jgi:hypothetical protein